MITKLWTDKKPSWIKIKTSFSFPSFSTYSICCLTVLFYVLELDRKCIDFYSYTLKKYASSIFKTLSSFMITVAIVIDVLHGTIHLLKPVRYGIANTHRSKSNQTLAPKWTCYQRTRRISINCCPAFCGRRIKNKNIYCYK